MGYIIGVSSSDTIEGTIGCVKIYFWSVGVGATEHYFATFFGAALLVVKAIGV